MMKWWWLSFICFFKAFPLVIGTVDFPKMAVVVHAGSPRMQLLVNVSIETWLSNAQLIVVDGHDKDITQRRRGRRRRRRLKRVFYENNPGCAHTGNEKPLCTNPTYIRTSGYYGAQRTVAGILMAFDTFPGIDWVYVMDEDNYADLRKIYNQLEQIDSSIPLLLAGVIGPRAGHNIKCLDINNSTHWSCCRNLTQPCLVNITNLTQGKQAVFKYKADSKSYYLDHYCEDEISDECCRTAPWPEGITKG